MTLSFPIAKAGRILKEGGVVAYPTEGVFGLGCLPGHRAAVERLLEIKQRDSSLGLVLIGSRREQLAAWAELPDAPLESSAEHPVTWVLPARPSVPAWIRGRHAGVAVRITAHPVAAALCDAAGSALVSTSANRSGQAPTRSPLLIRRRFARQVDFVVPGRCGAAAGPSEIRDFASGKTLRPPGGNAH